MKISKKPPRDGFFKRHFVHKDLFIKQQDEMHFFALTTTRQTLIFFTFLLAFLWTAFTSFYFFYNPSFLSQTKEKLEQKTRAYTYLEKEMKAFELFISEMLEACEQEESVKETASFLKDRFDLMKENLPEKSFKEKEELTLNQALLQRDMAVSQSTSFEKKVLELQDLIEQMQETQLFTFRKMADISETNIFLIEDELKDIKTSLIKTGLGMEYLLKRVRTEKEKAGITVSYSQVQPSTQKHQLDISLVSLNKVMNHWYDLTALRKSLPLGKPVKRIRITSAFGSRGDPFQGGPALHEGVDLAGMIGEPIYTRAPGKVVRASQWGWYGNLIEIDHGLGFRTRYAHMDQMFVSKGDTVRAGDRIGTVGNTGRSTGPHLHYEIRANGHAVDPMDFIKAGDYVFKN